MNAQQLKQQLLREMKAHPAKAGLLFLLLVVAAVYWAPLLLGGWGGDAPAPAADAADAPIAHHATAAMPAAAPHAAPPAGGQTPPSASPPPAARGDTSGDALRWRQLLAALHSDALHQPRRVLGWLRDPFQPIPTPLEAPPPATAQPVVPETGLADQHAEDAPRSDLALQLHGTIIGPHQRAALIGQRAYRQGRWLDDGQGGRLLIVRIEPRAVTLRRGNEEFVVEMPPPQRSGVLELQPAVD